jgi:hypothetical protein
VKYLLFLLGGFEVSDGIITHLLAGNGLVREANPLMTSIVREGNFLMLKVIGGLFCVLILWYLYRRFRKMTLIATSSVVLFYGVVIVWNMWVFFSGQYPL